MTNYTAMKRRVTSAKSEEDFKQCEKSLNILWDNKLLTVSEFGGLDVKLMEQIATKESE